VTYARTHVRTHVRTNIIQLRRKCSFGAIKLVAPQYVRGGSKVGHDRTLYCTASPLNAPPVLLMHRQSVIVAPQSSAMPPPVLSDAPPVLSSGRQSSAIHRRSFLMHRQSCLMHRQSSYNARQSFLMQPPVLCSAQPVCLRTASPVSAPPVLI